MGDGITRWAKIKDSYSLRRDAAEGVLMVDDDHLLGLLRGRHDDALVVVDSVLGVLGLDVDDVNADPEEEIRETVEAECLAELIEVLPEDFNADKRWGDATSEVARCAEALGQLSEVLGIDEGLLHFGAMKRRVSDAIDRFAPVTAALDKLGIEDVSTSPMSWGTEEAKRIAGEITAKAEEFKELEDRQDRIKYLVYDLHAAACPDYNGDRDSAEVEDLIRGLAAKAEESVKTPPVDNDLCGLVAALYYRIKGEEHVDGGALDVRATLSELHKYLGPLPKF